MILILALSTAHASDQADVGFIAEPQVIVDLANDRPREDGVEAWTRLRANASGNLENDSRWFLAVHGEHQTLMGVESQGGDLEANWDAWVGESGWEGPLFGSVRLRAGNLVERWGKLDLLPVVDVFTPRRKMH